MSEIKTEARRQDLVMVEESILKQGPDDFENELVKGWWGKGCSLCCGKGGKPALWLYAHANDLILCEACCFSVLGMLTADLSRLGPDFRLRVDHIQAKAKLEYDELVKECEKSDVFLYDYDEVLKVSRRLASQRWRRAQEGFCPSLEQLQNAKERLQRATEIFAETGDRKAVQTFLKCSDEDLDTAMYDIESSLRPRLREES